MEHCADFGMEQLVKNAEEEVSTSLRKLGLAYTKDDPVYSKGEFEHSIPREIELTGVCADEVASRVKSCVLQEGLDIEKTIAVIKAIAYTTVVPETNEKHTWLSLYFYFISKK
jgi:hypothetical protein